MKHLICFLVLFSLLVLTLCSNDALSSSTTATPTDVAPTTPTDTAPTTTQPPVTPDPTQQEEQNKQQKKQEKLDAILSQLKKTNDKQLFLIQTELESLKQHTQTIQKKLETLQQDNLACNEQLEDTRTRATYLNQKLIDSNKLKFERDENFSELEKKLSDLTRLDGEKEKIVNTLNNENKEVKNILTSLEDEFQQLRAQDDAGIKEFNQRVEKLENEKNNFKNQFEEISEKIKLETEKSVSLQKLGLELQKKNTELDKNTKVDGQTIESLTSDLSIQKGKNQNVVARLKEAELALDRVEKERDVRIEELTKKYVLYIVGVLSSLISLVIMLWCCWNWSSANLDISRRKLIEVSNQCKALKKKVE